MRINIKAILFAASFLYGISAFADNQWIQLAPITPQTLNQFVEQTGLFKDAQGPTVKQTQLYSISANNHEHYSIYTMQPQQTIGKVTRYKTTEQIADGSRFPGIPKWEGAVVHGQGLSLGGIFWPKEQMLAYNNAGQVIYDNRIDITAIKPISGNLFPMKVGDVLKFGFKRTHSRMIAGKTTVTQETGVMTYKVVKEFSSFSYSKNPVPAPIYEIQVWETTNLNPKPYMTDIYQYSDGFHWYISDKYFTTQNQLIAWYRVKHWL